MAAADAEVPLSCLRWNANTPASVTLDLSTMALPALDYLDVVIGCNPIPGPEGTALTPPASAWLSAERASYAAAVAKTQANIMIVPFQDQGYGLDRIERALMTLDLAYELGAHARIADPQLVARALGEGARRFERTAVLELAAKLGVHKVIMGYVGHDRNHAMTVTLQVLTVQPGVGGERIVQTRQSDWRVLPFTDKNPPFATFHALLPQVAKALAIVPAPIRSTAVEPASVTLNLSASPLDLVTSRKSQPAVTVITLLGALASPHAELARERLFERAFVVSTRFDPPGERASFLQSYALMNLAHRPAALERIRGSQQPAAMTLRAALNGDLLEMEAALKTVTDPYLGALLSVTLQDMRYAYNVGASPADITTATPLGGVQQQWLLLIGSRLSDENPWTVDSAHELKSLFDEIFPAQGLDLGSVMPGARNDVSSGDANVDWDIGIAQHIRHLVGEFAPLTCCEADHANHVSRWDLLWLLESRAEARLVKSLFRLDELQGSPAATMKLLDRYESFFAGHPGLAAARANAARELIHSAGRERGATLSDTMAQSAQLAGYWSPGENRTAYSVITTMRPPIDKTFWLEDAYAYDFPRRSFWPAMFYLGAERDPAIRFLDFAKESLEYSQVDLDPLAALPRLNEVDKRRLYADLQSRFLGAPHRIDMLATVRPKNEAPTDPQAQLRASIAAEPDTWSHYYELAKLLISKDGDYAQAHQVLLSYGRFQNIAHPLNPVQLSNEAEQSGSLFYFYGHTELSKELYKIASDLDTGSAASLTSAIHLKLLAEDWQDTLASSAMLVQRYPDSYAYRDYLSLLHAMGKSARAWQEFSQVASAFGEPQMWFSALVGHRIEGRSERDVRAWLQRPEIRNARFGRRQYAPAFAILWNATDRMPAPDLDRFVQSLDDEPGTPVQHVDGIADTPDLVYFAAGYTKLKHREWAQSLAAFKEMAEHYSLDAGEDAFALPYFAMAAIKAGDGTQPERLAQEQQIPGGFEIQGTFYRMLTRALLAGADKKLDAAESLIRGAFNTRSGTGYEPITTEYEFAEVCEWLFLETQDRRFIEILLDYLKEYERIQPTHAWAYALEYTFEAPGERRIRALAMALYFDPASQRIKPAPKSDVVEARRWLAMNNPFAATQPRKPSTAARSDSYP
jgi:hypothetical protein